MELTPGMILEGSVKSIAKFGAFIALPDGKLGLVHISEVASAYVTDISKHLAVGQTVRVKVVSVEPSGRISLSIKQAEPKPKPQPQQPQVQPAAPESFEDKLKQFMAISNDRIAGVRQYEHRTRSRKR